MVRPEPGGSGPQRPCVHAGSARPGPWAPSPVGVSWHEMTGVLGYTATKDDLQKRLARIEGQVRGVSKMVAEDRYCIDVLTQISAIQAALDKVALGLLDAVGTFMHSPGFRVALAMVIVIACGAIWYWRREHARAGV